MLIRCPPYVVFFLRQEIMRATLAMFVFVMGLFILTTADDIRNFRRFLTLRPRTVFLKHRTKLRDSCGFKPNQMSTAIGFGKRFVSRSFPKIVSGTEELTPDEALNMILERLRGILPEKWVYSTNPKNDKVRKSTKWQSTKLDMYILSDLVGILHQIDTEFLFSFICFSFC